MEGTLNVLGIIGLVLWVLVSLALLGSLAYALPVVRRLRRTLSRVDRLLDKSEPRIEPILTHLERSADNTDYITSAIRSDVESIGRTVEHASRSTRRMVEMAEERFSEINGFLEVVQEEAEDTFVSTASALRAIRGARSGEDDRKKKEKRFA